MTSGWPHLTRQGPFFCHSTSDQFFFKIGDRKRRDWESFQVFQPLDQSLPGFWTIIEECWGTSMEGNMMSSVITRLKLIKGRLKEWSARMRRELYDKQANVREEIKCLQKKIDIMGLSEGDLSNLLRLKNEAIKLANIEEQNSRQKCRINWLKLVDHNTGFFQRSLALNRE